MTKQNSSGTDTLERIFHEPNRLAIMSAVCPAEKGLTFRELRDTTGMTDGNLNRHLKVLRDAKAVNIKKKFVAGKPQTTITISAHGLKCFSEYLTALETVLQNARRAIQPEQKTKAVTGTVTAAI